MGVYIRIDLSENKAKNWLSPSGDQVMLAIMDGSVDIYVANAGKPLQTA